MSEKQINSSENLSYLSDRKITLIEKLDSKNSKKVYRALRGNMEANEKVILKITPQESNELESSVKFYTDDNMKYFVEMIDVPFHKDKKTYILFKYYEQGSISRYILNENLSQTEKQSLIKNILEIGCYLHKNNYLHCDIKPDNFFMDNHKARLGDLESIHKLEKGIHTSGIESLLGTRGFKYSQYENYDIKDEIFAYVATIYFIETKKTLLTPKEIDAIDMGENPIDAINDFVSPKIEEMEDDNLKNFLRTTLNELETDRQVDCCSLLSEFETLTDQDIIIDTPPPEVEFIKDKPNNNLTIFEKIKVFMGTFKIPLLGTGLIVIGAIVFATQKEPTPPVEKNDTRVSTIIAHENITLDITQAQEEPISTSEVKIDESNVTQEMAHIIPSTEVQEPTIPSVAIQQEIPNNPEKIVVKPKVSKLAKNIASHRIIDESVLTVRVKESIKVGKSLNIRITSHKDGYLQLLFIDTMDQIQVAKPRRMTSNTLFSVSDHTIRIPTTKPTGLHYVVVIFAAKKYEFTPKNYLKIIKSFEDQAYGNEYINIFPINIHP